jgi:hypothetical protein
MVRLDSRGRRGSDENPKIVAGPVHKNSLFYSPKREETRSSQLPLLMKHVVLWMFVEKLVGQERVRFLAFRTLVSAHCNSRQ